MTAHGGKRPGAGRKKGTRNKATAEQLASLTELAQSYSDVALNTLATICQKSDSDAARVSAANSLLDRGYGRPAQSLEHTGAGGGPIQIARVERTIVDPASNPADSDA